MIATVLGTLAAVGLARTNFPFKGLLMSVLIAPMVVPIVVVGVSTYLFFAPLGLADSYIGLIVVHAALGAPFVLTTVLATLQGFNHNLVRASLSLGANPLTTFFRVTLPVIAPGVISGALFAFATSFDEVVVDAVPRRAGPGDPAAPDVHRHPREHHADDRRRGDAADRLHHEPAAGAGMAARAAALSLSR